MVGILIQKGLKIRKELFLTWFAHLGFHDKNRRSQLEGYAHWIQLSGLSARDKYKLPY